MKLYNSTLRLIASSTALLAITSSIAFAEVADTVHLGKSEVSKEQIIQLLSPNANGAPKTRGLRLHNQDPKPSTAETVARALSLEVYFEFDSADLTPEAMQQLSPVGEALRSNELANVDFTFEGHTDASGADGYNLQLSEKRAESVKNFFINNYALQPERVSALGKGESELIDGTNPTSGVNRRVTIIAK